MNGSGFSLTIHCWGDSVTYYKRVPLLMTLDSAFVLFSFFMAHYFLYPASTISFSYSLALTLFVLVFCNQLLAHSFRLYNKAWEYASVGELKTIIRVVTYSLLIANCVKLFYGSVDIRMFVSMWMFQVFLIGGSRFSWRLYRDRYIKPRVKKRKR